MLQSQRRDQNPAPHLRMNDKIARGTIGSFVERGEVRTGRWGHKMVGLDRTVLAEVVDLGGQIADRHLRRYGVKGGP